MAQQFTLQNYTREIQNYMTEHKKSAEDALHDFVVNLTTMKPHNEGFGNELNFHQLGQQWNDLKYTEKRAQRREMLKTLSRTSRRGAEKEV